MLCFKMKCKMNILCPFCKLVANKIRGYTESCQVNL